MPLTITYKEYPQVSCQYSPLIQSDIFLRNIQGSPWKIKFSRGIQDSFFSNDDKM
jgi:hypothetical protein